MTSDAYDLQVMRARYRIVQALKWKAASQC